MSLYGTDLRKNADEKFEDIEWKINAAASIGVADIIAKYREEMMDVLKSNEAENDEDQRTLEHLINKLHVKSDQLETDLWKTSPCKIDLSNNDGIKNFWESIVNGSNPKLLSRWWTSPTNSEVDTLKARIEWLLEDIQFLHDDWNQTREKTRKLFKGSSTDMTDIWETLKDPLISTLLNQTNSSKVKNDVDNFVRSVWKTKWNPFYIQSTKLFDNPQREVAIRVSLYLYCAYKLITDSKKISKELLDEIEDILDNQLGPCEIKKIKWLHNTKVELWYLEPEYETLKELNNKRWEINQGAHNVWPTPLDLSINLTWEYESWAPITANINEYRVIENKITVTDASWTVYKAFLADWMWNYGDLFSTLTNTKSADFYIEIWWQKVKIWKLILSNIAWNANFRIDIDDEATINTGFTNAWVTIPTWQLDFEIPVKWTKNVSNWLSWCKAALTKKVKFQLVPPVSSPSPIPTPHSPQTLRLRDATEREATITSVDQINRAIAEREAEEELEQRYEKIWWNIFDRANLFFRRKFIKHKIVSKKLWRKSGFDWSKSAEAAAHRHQIEKKENLADNLKELVNIDEKNYPVTRGMLDALIADVTGNGSTIPPWENGIDANQFKIRFEDILKQSGNVFDKKKPSTATIKKRKPINKIIKSNRIDSLSTNIYRQAKQFQAHQKMVYEIYNHITVCPSETDDQFYDWCKWMINDYIRKYDDIPDFLKQLEKTWIPGGLNIDNKNDIKILKWNDAALFAIQGKSMKYRLQILDGGWEAYSVKKPWLFLTKIWRLIDDPTENSRFFDKHPNLKEAFWWIRWTTKMWLLVAPSLLLPPAWPCAIATKVWLTSAVTTFLAKRSHYWEEHRSYLRAQANNVKAYRIKRKKLADEVAWMKRYQWRFWWKDKKNRNQYEQYVYTSHDQLELSSKLYNEIKHYLKKWIDLDIHGKGKLRQLLAEWLARLDYHKETGQNFLWSNNQNKSEKEYMQLQNAIIWWTLRLWILTRHLRGDYFYKRQIDLLKKWTGNDYNTQWYIKAKKRFWRRKWWKSAWWALKAWSISAWLSYIASSITNTNKIKVDTVENTQTMNSWKIWWYYNLWDIQEDLFVSWDVNPAMNSVINSSTSGITRWVLYSSVDAAHCGTEFWANQLTQAQADLTSALSNPIVSWNSNLVNAINNYVNDATTKISWISWLSAWNRDLAIARAIEAAKEWILEPIISSRNSLISIDPTCLSWNNPWTIQTTWGAIGQSFRNMWIANLDYIQKWTDFIPRHIVRAIPIPIPGFGNTFASPKSKVA